MDLDMPECCTEIGQTYGWLFDEDDDSRPNHIEYELVNVIDGDNRSFMIVLKPDGYIADKMWKKRAKFR